ncbi:SDR family oxidoreductase [Chitinispirillales bacterium ANBcel5]|uniref:SDR family oxidoreductase n=1 Tax=Cellulosispirillum alkaliphilum TaxID=3039283 RepID=UPI002A4EEFEA|nr:SDR family oxidoreductase [Chitinispirillales bacterium ANBcel5]
MANKTAIVTGGGQGIGKCIVRELLYSDYNVVVAEKDTEAGLECEEEYSSIGNVKFISTDTSDETSVNNLIEKTLVITSRIDVLINNAAVVLFKPLELLSLDEWNTVIGVNLTGYFLCAKACVPHIRKQRGSILNISSTRAMMSERDTESYSASKGGVSALTHALAVSLGPEIRVNSISPGWIETGNWKKQSKRVDVIHSDEDRNQHPAGRVGIPGDVASAVLFLLDDKNSFITGQDFVIDGGMSRKMVYV